MDILYMLDDHGEPVVIDDPLEWARWFETTDKSIKQTTLPSGTLVSTVFLGIDHNFFGYGPPILWETMIFGGPCDGMMDRHCSHDAALTGHEDAVNVALMVEHDLAARARVAEHANE